MSSCSESDDEFLCEDTQDREGVETSDISLLYLPQNGSSFSSGICLPTIDFIPPHLYASRELRRPLNSSNRFPVPFPLLAHQIHHPLSLNNTNPSYELSDSLVSVDRENDDSMLERQEKSSIMRRNRAQEETYHWIFNGGRTAVVYFRNLKDGDLLSYSCVREILDTTESCEERDELLMTESSGYYPGDTSLRLACMVASRSPSDEMMRLVKLLIERISDKNRKRFIKTVLDDLYEYSVDVCRCLFDSYDGNVVQLLTSSDCLAYLTDDLYRSILELVEDKYDVRKSIIQLCTTRYDAGVVIHRLAGDRRESALCEILKRLPLPSRRGLLSYRDTQNLGVTPLYLSRRTYEEINDMLLMEDFLYNPEEISDNQIKMLNFFANEYSVTSGINLTSYTLDTAGNAYVTHYHAHDVGGASIFFLSVHVETINHSPLDLMNHPDIQLPTSDDGKPKVVIIQILVKTTSTSNVPDSTCKLANGVKCFIQPVDFCWLFAYTSKDLRGSVSKCLIDFNSMVIQQKLSRLRQKLKTNSGVIYVSALYSTLGRRLTLAEPEDYRSMSSYSEPKTKGSALIICMTEGRAGDLECSWETEYNDARDVLGNLLGLKVEFERDLRGAEVITRMESFSRERVNDEYSVLVIMCHGDEKDRIITGDGSILSVQKVVNSFSLHNDHPKVVILQYCRGSKYVNRLDGTHEHQLVKLTVSHNKSDSLHVDGNRGKRSSIQRIVPSDNLYMVYATLSDSRAKRGFMFRRMKHVMLDMQRLLTNEEQYDLTIVNKPIDMIELMVDVAGDVRGSSQSCQHMETVDSLLQPLYVKLRPV